MMLLNLLSKRVMLLFYFLHFYSCINCQNYFSNRYNFYNQNNGGISFIIVKDTFYIPVQLLGTGESTLGKIDQNGNLSILNKYAAGFGGSYYFSNDLTKFKNAIYSTGAGGYYNKISSPLYKYNYNGDTLQTHYFGDTAYYFGMSKIIPYPKSKDKLLLIGATDSLCGPSHQGLYKPVIRVVDTNGVLYQTKTYLSDCKYRNINGANTTKNKGCLVSLGGTYGTWDTETRVLKLDSNLNLVWSKQINLTSSAEPEILNDNDHFYYMNSTKIDSTWNFSYNWERPCLIKMDTNGTVVWQKNYGVKQQTIGTTGLKKCMNGDFIIVGTRRTSPNELKGFIIRTDSIGNQKWWKEYRPNTTPILDTLAENYLYDIMELPNGDIAAVGWAGQSTISPLQQTWLLKVDSNGCFGAGNCPPNITTGVNELSNTESINITAYPNPFKDELNINYSILDFEGVAQLQLIELATGRIINSIELTESFGSKQFNTEVLANGIYLLSLKQNNKPSVNFKVINIK
jgi:hypothetical protein